ncbi:unnamed protein product [Paramecium sonneborni]|uniref:Uncharacterized protein n=1 Tax=Paramecium sonneborni TaxID=65129 RepID=A0A8S1QCT2_9CILI|nr:unnamed protein product [Paramecium sonneborni]
MNDCYYELESLINDLPQQTIASKIQQLFYRIINQEKLNSPILEVEKYFRKLIKKIEQFYCRRLQKLEYFISKKADTQLILLRISKYLEKKPWRLETMDYTSKPIKQNKIDDKNCNQFINFDNNQEEYYSSKTSTPFSHYTCIPSIPRDTSLNEAVFLDCENSLKSSSSFHFDKQEPILDISQIQYKLQQLIDNSPKKKLNSKKKQQLADLIDYELEEFSAQSPPCQNILDCNISDIKSGFNSRLISSRSLQKESVHQEQIPISSKQIPQTREFESLFQTQQSTKEILKYVEQYHQLQQQQQQQQSQVCYSKQQHFKARPSLEVTNNNNTIQCFQDKCQSPSTNKRYRVRSSYQKELPSQNKLKVNTSHENFEIRTSKSIQSKKKHFQLPSPLNESMNQQKQKQQQSNQLLQQQQLSLQQKKTMQRQQPQTLSSALSHLYKRFSQQKQSSSVVTKRSTKQTISYSLEKDHQKKTYKIVDYLINY